MPTGRPVGKRRSVRYTAARGRGAGRGHAEIAAMRAAAAAQPQTLGQDWPHHGVVAQLRRHARRSVGWPGNRPRGRNRWGMCDRRGGRRGGTGHGIARGRCEYPGRGGCVGLCRGLMRQMPFDRRPQQVRRRRGLRQSMTCALRQSLRQLRARHARRAMGQDQHDDRSGGGQAGKTPRPGLARPAVRACPGGRSRAAIRRPRPRRAVPQGRSGHDHLRNGLARRGCAWPGRFV